MSAATLETKVASHGLAGRYITFTPHLESYGIEVLKVREIIRHAAITSVPPMASASANGNGNGRAHAASEPATTAKRRSEIPLAGDFKDF